MATDVREHPDLAFALAWWREIRSGGGVDRGKYREAVNPGNVAEHLWNDGAFTLGVEYGVLMALAELFGLSDAQVFEVKT